MRLPMLEESTLDSALVMLSASPIAAGAVSLLGSLVAYGVYKVLAHIYGQLTSPLRHLPGPRSSNFILGHLVELHESDTTRLQDNWIRDYGSNFRFSFMFGTSGLYTTDLKAISYILANDYDFQKIEFLAYNVRQVVGNGLLLVEGDVHRKQRKILNPAFGPQQIRELTELFMEKTLQMRDIWLEEIVKQKGVAQVDGLSWLNRLTLDIIGLAGFNYKFNTLVNDRDNPFEAIVAEALKPNLFASLKAMFPIFRIIPTIKNPHYVASSIRVNAIVEKLISDSKAAVVADKDDSASKTWNRRDLLSLLIRANATSDLPENKRMNDADVVAQIFTFILGGHETSGVSTTWALFALTQDKEMQRKLREEINTIGTDNPSLDELNSLPYLNRIIRETLRIHPPGSFTTRMAMKDNVIPLSKPFTDTKGVVHNQIRINKGQTVLIPIAMVSRSKALWGEDALEFKPERWEKVPEASNAIPGVWGNSLTFLGGPRACIGYRFAISEMKAFLFTIIRTFEVDLAVPGNDIGKALSIVHRPTVLSQNSAVQLPLIIRPVSSEL